MTMLIEKVTWCNNRRVLLQKLFIQDFRNHSARISNHLLFESKWIDRLIF